MGRLLTFGFQRERAEGGMADYMHIPHNAREHKIADGISLEDAAIIEPLSCAIQQLFLPAQPGR
ncbi:hypothetical protein ACN28S_39200 [Cystobacter fuscus]